MAGNIYIPAVSENQTTQTGSKTAGDGQEGDVLLIFGGRVAVLEGWLRLILFGNLILVQSSLGEETHGEDGTLS